MVLSDIIFGGKRFQNKSKFSVLFYFSERKRLLKWIPKVGK